MGVSLGTGTHRQATFEVSLKQVRAAAETAGTFYMLQDLHAG